MNLDEIKIENNIEYQIIRVKHEKEYELTIINDFKRKNAFKVLITFNDIQAFDKGIDLIL